MSLLPGSESGRPCDRCRAPRLRSRARRLFRHVAARLLGTLPLLVLAALPLRAAESWPDKPVRLLVGYAAGGGADTTARVMASKLSEQLGQQFVVENRTGASGIIAEEAVARAAPDGYTLLIAAATHAVNPALYSKLPFDVIADFTPITLLLRVPNVLAVHPSLPVHSVQDMIDLARSKPGGLSYASTGNGSAQFLSAELFKSMTHTDIVGIPYRGGGPALIDVVGGHVPLIFGNVASTLPYIRGGGLRGIATTGTERAAVLPDLPTFIEAGLPGFAVYEWNGVLGPPKMDPALLARLHDAMIRALQAPDVAGRLKGLGADLVGSTPDAFGTVIRDEVAKWGRVIREAGIQPG